MSLKLKSIIVFSLAAGVISTASAQKEPYMKFRGDFFQYKSEKSIRIREMEPQGKFYLVTADGTDTVYSGNLTEEKKSVTNPKLVTKANFTEFEGIGKFRLYVPGVDEPTGVFEISPLDDHIRLNQVGFYPNGDKIAIVSGAKSRQFFITSPDLKDTLFGGPLQKEKAFEYGNEVVREANFTRFTTPGKYRLAIPDMGTSAEFEIKEKVHEDILKAALKAYYFNRSSIALDEKYAGQWKRPLGHPDDKVMIHPSAASKSRPAGSFISSPRGWYDAGDYGKYIVNSGISTYTILAAYEHYPEYFKSLKVDIPEAGNSVPDILDEALWNVRWMLTMQDPEDGGVYHKLTTASFEGAVMPHEAVKQRYVVMKSTAATLDFAAVMAQASRIYKDFGNEFPGLADSCQKAAITAYKWAKSNPEVQYLQSVMNGNHDPDVVTGEYGDSRFTDEFFWAAAELYITTGDGSYANEINLSGGFGVPGWSNVNTLGLISLAMVKNGKMAAAKDKLISTARSIAERYKTNPYETVMGSRESDFVWGSNSTAGNQSLLTLAAYQLTGENLFYDASLANLDYLLGRNATGYCFVTGFGDKSPTDIHHRQSKGDGIDEPVPGFLAGGPQPGQQDGCNYPDDKPATCYSDSWCSYSTNEITINWNAPLVYMAAAIEARNSSK